MVFLVSRIRTPGLRERGQDSIDNPGFLRAARGVVLSPWGTGDGNGPNQTDYCNFSEALGGGRRPVAHGRLSEHVGSRGAGGRGR